MTFTAALRQLSFAIATGQRTLTPPEREALADLVATVARDHRGAAPQATLKGVPDE